MQRNIGIIILTMAIPILLILSQLGRITQLTLPTTLGQLSIATCVAALFLPGIARIFHKQYSIRFVSACIATAAIVLPWAHTIHFFATSVDTFTLQFSLGLTLFPFLPITLLYLVSLGFAIYEVLCQIKLTTLRLSGLSTIVMLLPYYFVFTAHIIFLTQLHGLTE